MLRKSFPKERHYEFWVIFMCYRIHKDAKNDGQTRNIFGTMAYKMLEKAASQTPVGDQDTVWRPCYVTPFTNRLRQK